jgi:hypothetical protein
MLSWLMVTSVGNRAVLPDAYGHVVQGFRVGMSSWRPALLCSRAGQVIA